MGRPSEGTIVRSPPIGDKGFRPIHYLGSKLRLLEPILEAMGEVDGPVCDLFAGSGTVSAALAARHDVISVDVQLYSTTLCTALLCPPPALAAVHRQAEADVCAPRFERIAQAFAPLIELEAGCLDAARAGEVAPLADLIDHGSVVGGGAEGAPRALAEAHREVALRLGRLDEAGRRACSVTRYFGGVYFSYAQALDLDAALDVAHGAPGRARQALLAPVLSTASDVVNTVGKHFAQPVQLRRKRDGAVKPHLLQQCLRDRGIDVLSAWRGWLGRYAEAASSTGRHRVMQADVARFLAGDIGDIGAFYADPPYTRDHYSRFYHVLETMCLRDEPAVSTNTAHGRTHPSRGVYRAERHQSPFSTKSLAPAAFDALFAATARVGAPLILSYSPFESAEGRPRMVGVDQLLSLAERHYGQVDVRSMEHGHNRFNTSERNRAIRPDGEVLIRCD